MHKQTRQIRLAVLAATLAAAGAAHAAHAGTLTLAAGPIAGQINGFVPYHTPHALLASQGESHASYHGVQLGAAYVLHRVPVIVQATLAKGRGDVEVQNESFGASWTFHPIQRVSLAPGVVYAYESTEQHDLGGGYSHGLIGVSLSASYAIKPAVILTASLTAGHQLRNELGNGSESRETLVVSFTRLPAGMPGAVSLDCSASRAFVSNFGAGLGIQYQTAREIGLSYSRAF